MNVSGAPGLPDDEGFQALRGVDAGAQARAHSRRQEPPGHRPVSAGDAIGVDTNGDGRVDLEIVMFPCTDSNQPANGPSPTSCIEAWVADMSDWRLALVDRLVMSCS